MLLCLCLARILCLKLTPPSQVEQPLPESFLTFLMRVKCPSPNTYILASHHILYLPICTSVAVTRHLGSSTAEAVPLFCAPRSPNNVHPSELSHCVVGSFHLFSIFHQWSYRIGIISLVLCKRKLWKCNWLTFSFQIKYCFLITPILLQIRGVFFCLFFSITLALPSLCFKV